MKTLSIVSGLVLLACARPAPQSDPMPRAAPPNPAPNEVNTSEDARQGAKSIDQILQGRISGVNVYSAPGGGIVVRFTGAGSFYSSEEPLFVIDGIATEVQRGTLRWLSPHDIESIRALKGPDAAIYGVRGANGVIVIKTKGSH